VLAADQATRARRAIRRHPGYQRPELLATGPRHVWSWDSTTVRGPAPGVWYTLDVGRDIVRRAMMGWRRAEHEDAQRANRLMATACRAEQIVPNQLPMHADRGAPMPATTLAAWLAR